MPPTEKEKSQKLQEKFQAILSALLREEENKYCVDCDAKGPRWASWNLGVFLCIRCAGIHRNLGVHISRVKSVNLDQWTTEQIASMQAMGNAKGREIYERNLSENFRRSQTDSAMEQFIRSKYEQKKWIAKDWTPESAPTLKEDETVKEKKKTSSKLVLGSMAESPKAAASKKIVSNPSEIDNSKQVLNIFDNSAPLVDFGTETVIQNFASFDNNLFENNNSKNEDINFLNDSLVNTTTTTTAEPSQLQQTNKVTSDFEGLLIGSTNIETNSAKKIDKNSILALYSSGFSGSTQNFASTQNSTNNSAKNTNNFFQTNPIQQHQHQNQQQQQQQNQFNNFNNNQLFQLNFPQKNQTTLKSPQTNFEDKFTNKAPVMNQTDNFNAFFDAPLPSSTGNTNTFSSDLWH